MDKYSALWKHINQCGKPQTALTFEEIEETCGVLMDHSFLKYKSQLLQYGYTVKKISMKEKTVLFERLDHKKEERK